MGSWWFIAWFLLSRWLGNSQWEMLAVTGESNFWESVSLILRGSCSANPKLLPWSFWMLITGWGRFVSFRFRFPGTGCLAFRFVGAYGSVRFAKMIGSFRFVSHLFNIFSVSFRFVSQTVCDFSEFAWGKQCYILESLRLRRIGIPEFVRAMSKKLPKHLAPPALAANPVDVFAFLTALKKQIPVWAGLLFSGQICFFQGVEKTNGILWGCAVCQAAHEP